PAEAGVGVAGAVLLPETFVAGCAVGCKEDDSLLHPLHQRAASDHFVVGVSHQNQSGSQEGLQRICWHSIVMQSSFASLRSVKISRADSHPRLTAQILRFAQDFACGLPLSFASLTPAYRLNFAWGVAHSYTSHLDECFIPVI